MAELMEDGHRFDGANGWMDMPGAAQAISDI